MSNPTTNFGWQMPTATDLVTDLPADFEVFGQAVDTDLADLNGGTTGQVLSKTSGTDLDFTWVDPTAGDITGVTAGTGISGGGTSGTVTVTNSMATAIDAKGDLIAGTADDTFSALAVGANDTVLTADSTTPTGLKWATSASGGMSLLSTTSLTGATTTISAISGDYVDLVIFVFGVTNDTANGNFLIAPNGTTNITSVQRTNNPTTVTDNSDDYLYLTANNFAPLRTNADNTWRLVISNYSSTTSRKAIFVNGGYKDPVANRGVYVSGFINTTSAITSLVFSNGGGNLSTGTVLLYGVK
jgi:hypothetical protein